MFVGGCVMVPDAKEETRIPSSLSLHLSLPPFLPTIEDGTKSHPGLSMLTSICSSELILIVFSSIYGREEGGREGKREGVREGG